MKTEYFFRSLPDNYFEVQMKLALHALADQAFKSLLLTASGCCESLCSPLPAFHSYLRKYCAVWPVTRTGRRLWV